MEERLETTLTILAWVSLALIFIFTCIFIAHFIEMLNDHRCYNLPPQEFFNDPKCERYWEDYDKD